MEFLVGLFILAMIIGIYLAPTLLAADRKDPNIWSIGAINVFLGWTLVGWVVALAMALRHHKGPEPSRAPIAPTLSGHVSTTGTAPVPETVEGIKQLADLHERGLLTEAEFAAAKARLLESSPPGAAE